MAKKLRIGVFGGARGTAMIEALLHHPEAELAAVCDRYEPLLVQAQKKAEELAKEDELILLCGHYEGVDQRVLDAWNMEEISIGDYILTGGELPAAIITDAIVRLIPGAIGDEQSDRIGSTVNGSYAGHRFVSTGVFPGRGRGGHGQKALSRSNGRWRTGLARRASRARDPRSDSRRVRRPESGRRGRAGT